MLKICTRKKEEKTLYLVGARALSWEEVRRQDGTLLRVLLLFSSLFLTVLLCCNEWDVSEFA